MSAGSFQSEDPAGLGWSELVRSFYQPQPTWNVQKWVEWRKLQLQSSLQGFPQSLASV